MEEIRFSTGLKSFKLRDISGNRDCEVFFNPTDMSFIERLYAAFDALDKMQAEYDAEKAKPDGGDARSFFETARKWDESMRACVDEAFSAPVCAAVFGTMNVYAMSEGLPIWANLLLSVMETVETTFGSESKLTDPRISKYVLKYKRK